MIAVYLAVFAAITAALAAGGPLVELDLAVHHWSAGHRPPVAEVVAGGLNRLGQGAVFLAVSWVLAEWLGLRLRSVWPVLYVLAASVMLVPTVLAVKWVTERGAPGSLLLPPERTVSLTGPLPAGEYAAGYPSGHVVNAVVWYGVMLLLVTALLRVDRRPVPSPALRLAVRVVPVVGVLGATTYLSFHWLTDALAGLALGLAIDRALRLVPWVPP